MQTKNPKSRLALVAALACVGLMPGLVAAAEEQTPAAPTVWINTGLQSRHFDRNTGHRENNSGFGVDWVVAPDHVLMTGRFRNSDDQATRFAAWNWRPFHWRRAEWNIHLGLAAGLFDGYPKYREGAVFLAALPLLSVEYKRVGADIAIIPDIPNRLQGAIAIRLKLGIW